MITGATHGFRMRAPQLRTRVGWSRAVLVMGALFVEAALLPLLLVRALIARLSAKSVDAGFGPDPLINNVYHRRAMQLAGHSAETFCIEPYFITREFDRVFLGMGWSGPLRLLGIFIARIRCFWWVVGRHRVLYASFAGGPLGPMQLLWRFEPALLRLAGVRTVILPFGGDVHLPERIDNLAFRFALDADYPDWYLQASRVRRLVPLWTRGADCVYAGCDWVDCMDHAHVIGLAHFTIDTDLWNGQSPEIPPAFSAERPMRVLHAPNHRAIKGSDRIIEAVERVRRQGRHVELTLLERQPNESVRQAMSRCDVVADQLIIGWYAMFALEGMSMRRAVICNMRADLVALHAAEGTQPEEGFPFVQADCTDIARVLEDLHDHPDRIRQAGLRGRAFVERHHSLQAGANLFGAIQARLGVRGASGGSSHHVAP